MVTEQACRERGTEMYETYESLKSTGNHFDSLLSRLQALGNKLWDDSSDLKAGPLSKEPNNRIVAPGAISDFNRCASGLKELAERFETQIIKLEKII